jgi:hypothetical protein
LPNATGLVARILEEWEQVIDAVEVVPGTGGIFDVYLNGGLRFTKAMLGRTQSLKRSFRSSANTSADHALGLCRTVCLTPRPARDRHGLG